MFKCLKLFNFNKYENKLLNKFKKVEDFQLESVKILIITDTHNSLYYDEESVEKIKNSVYDVCLILGDISNRDIDIILKYVPFEKIYGILGNHDGLDRFNESKIRNIHGKIITINNVKIAAIQGSNRYKNGDYGMLTQEESLEIAKQMEGADILVSHDRPFVKDNNDNVHDGLKGLTYYCYKNHIKLEIHGHLHENSKETLKNGTKVIGAYKVMLIDTADIE